MDITTSSDQIGLGYSVSLSGDGNTLSFGAVSFETGASIISVRLWDGTAWIQKGLRHYTSPGEGESLTLSSDGNTLMYGGHGPQNDGIASVYDWNGTDWVEAFSIKGIDISPTADIAYSISLSSDGNTLVLPERSNEEIYVYERSGTNWVQKGVAFYEEAKTHTYGHQITSVSSDGNTIAVGLTPQPYSDLIGDLSLIRVYTWTGTDWIQKGADTHKWKVSYQPDEGATIALSADGNTLAVSAPFNDLIDEDAGLVRVFTYE